MGYYIDITISPVFDVSLSFLWRKVYQQIHLGLVGMMNSEKKAPIGVSFPEYQGKKTNEMSLGRRLRLYAKDKDVLERFNVSVLLGRLMDYVEMTGIRSVPSNVKAYARFKRVQSKSSTERMARRKAKRQGVSYEQAMDALKDRENVFVKAPFINMPSASTGVTFPLVIVREAAQELIDNGFNCYGLSALSSVPDF